MRYITPVIKWGKEVGPKVWSRTKETSGKVKQYTTDAFSKMHQSKQWQTASKSINEMSGKVTTKYKKLPESYKTGLKVAGVLGATGAGITGAMALSPKLKKNDPRYKIMKEKRWV